MLTWEIWKDARRRLRFRYKASKPKQLGEKECEIYCCQFLVADLKMEPN